MNINDIKKALAECQHVTGLTDNQARMLWGSLPLSTRNKYAAGDKSTKNDKGSVKKR